MGIPARPGQNLVAGPAGSGMLGTRARREDTPPPQEPAMIQAIPPTTLPRPIRRALRRVDARLRSSASARGLGMALLVGGDRLALGMAADFAWTLPTGRPLGDLGRRGWRSSALSLAGRGGPAVAPAVAVDRPGGGGRAGRPPARRAADRLDRPARRREPPNGSPALIAALAEDAAGSRRRVRPVAGQRARAGRSGGWSWGWSRSALVAAPACSGPTRSGRWPCGSSPPGSTSSGSAGSRSSVTPGDKVAAVGPTSRSRPR